MHKIQANASGTRSIEVSDKHLETIHRYQLLSHLVDSNGIIDEGVVDRLKLNVRSLLSGEGGQDKDLLDLCLDVVYNSNMKATALSHLLTLYAGWQKEAEKKTDEGEPAKDAEAE
ncbi:MAG: hypothetical protein II562_03680 [Prevotella sp.]|nr:hypothetical protein [Prevotella sp.]